MMQVRVLPRILGTVCLLGIWATVAQSAEPSPANWVPADVGVFIRMDGAAELRQQWEADPVSELMAQRMPHRERPEAWKQLVAAMGLTSEALFDRYFGRRIVVVARRTGEGAPGVLLSRVEPADRDLALEKLDLREIGRAGDFTIYTSDDNQGRVAFSDKWMALGDRKHEDYLRQILHGPRDGASLAESEDFKTWTGKLPEGGRVLAFVRREVVGYPHALSVHFGPERRLSVYYAGHTPEISNRLEQRLGKADARDFGPLPMSVMGAVSLNIVDRSPDPRIVEQLDKFVAPASYEKDILPKIDPPLVLFMGSMPGRSVKPDPGFDVPVVGAAWRLKNRSVAPHLTRAMDRAMVLVNLALIKHKTGPVAFRSENFAENSDYRVADGIFGPVALKFGRPELQGILRPAYGPVGDWYVVASHDAFLRQCYQTAKNKVPGLAQSKMLSGLPVRRVKHPVMTAFVQAPVVSHQLRTWVQHVRRMAPEQQELLETLDHSVKVLGHYQAASLQVYHDGDDAIHAELHVTRR